MTLVMNKISGQFRVPTVACLITGGQEAVREMRREEGQK
jgi:hypothetical protein